MTEPVGPVKPRGTIVIPTDDIIREGGELHRHQVFDPVIATCSSPGDEELDNLVIDATGDDPTGASKAEVEDYPRIASPGTPVIRVAGTFDSSSLLECYGVYAATPAPSRGVVPEVEVAVVSFVHYPATIVADGAATTPARTTPTVPVSRPVPTDAADTAPELTPRLVPEA